MTAEEPLPPIGPLKNEGKQITDTPQSNYQIPDPREVGFETDENLIRVENGDFPYFVQIWVDNSDA